MTTAVEPREHTVEARGILFHYVEWGDPGDPVIVCLHGLTSMCRIWDRFARPFSGRYRVIAVSQRGHGDTSWPRSPDYSTDDYVADLEALVDRWRLDRFVLIGLSMGGMNSMAYAARNPDRVTHLVPVDIPPSVDRSKSPTLEVDRHVAEHGYPTFEDHQAVLKVMRLTNQISPDEALLHRLRYQLKQTPDGKWTYKQDPRVSYHWRPRDLWDDLPKITCPVLIVRGGRSWVFSERAARRMQQAFPNAAELVTIPEAGHTVPEDCPEAFNAAVEAFLARHPVD